MKLKYYLLLIILFSVCFIIKLKADKSYDSLLLDGSETLAAYGLDTTSHWWAITKPYSNQYRLTVDGIISKSYLNMTYPVFSPDGNRWACFARDNSQWYVLTNDNIISLPGDSVGEINFSPNSQNLVYSYFESDNELIIINDKKIRVYARRGKFYLSNNAERIAFMGYKADGYVLNIGNWESPVYDEILPVGFWYDANMLYAARNGTTWRIYKGENPVSEIYKNIYDSEINLAGNVAAFSAIDMSGAALAILISDDYIEPILTRKYQSVYNLTLHPSAPMIGFNAVYEGVNYVILNTAEYYGGEFTGKPFFTNDGSELVYVGCKADCFVGINGRQFKITGGVTETTPIAVKPQSRTIAYVTNSSLIIRYLERNEMVSGMMVDSTFSPRYNWRMDRYEALGIINNRLYLLTCKI